MEFRKAYDPPSRVRLDNNSPTMTHQSFQDECDINNIMRKYQKTGLLTHVQEYGGRYDELPSDLDYQAACNQVINARSAFDSLPSGLRTRFNNDPAAFLRFVQDPANEEEMQRLGLTPNPLAEQEPAEPAPSEPPAEA